MNRCYNNDVPINNNSRFPEGSLPRKYYGQFKIETQYFNATFEWQTILLDNDKDKWLKIIVPPEPMDFVMNNTKNKSLPSLANKWTRA